MNQRDCSRYRQTLGTLLILAGIVIATIPLAMRVQATYWQWRLSREFENPVVIPDASEVIAASDENPEGSSDEPGHEVVREFRPTRLEIPKINLSVVVSYGTSQDILARGPGMYPEGCFPGEEGNTAIAAHRTTYGAWFRKLDLLREGDEIIVTFGDREYIYQVEDVFVVAKNDWSVIDPTPYRALTLTTCHPPGSSTQRLVVRAREVYSRPRDRGDEGTRFDGGT